jgi:protein ImuB
MRRVISLYLPHWPSDRLRRMRREFSARDKPLVTAMMQGQRRILASVDEAAVRVGLTCRQYRPSGPRRSFASNSLG